tara:strand:- start:60 stop:470 length:411 start_codon:yes stop_codon:yes gene_type:complete
MKKRKFIYVVQEITVTQYDIVGGVIVGAYDSAAKAREAVTAHKHKNKHKHKKKDSESEFIEYDIVMCPLNKIPYAKDLYEKALYSLIEKGLMEPLVGEDGYFHYELTEKGREEVEKLQDGNSLIDDELQGGEEGID